LDEVDALYDVREPGFEQLAPRVMWPARPDLARVLATVLPHASEDCAALIAADRESDWDGVVPPDDEEVFSRSPRRHAEGRTMLSASTMGAKDAWARLSPPGGWSERRVFVGPRVASPREADGPLLSVPWGTWKISGTPPDLDAVLALAADPVGTGDAEDLALEASSRLAPWGFQAPRRTAWFIENEPRLLDYREAQPVRQRFDELLQLSPERLSQGDIKMWVPRIPRDAWRVSWLRAAKRDLVRAHTYGEVASSGAAPFASRPNPFEPIVRIWSLGYGLAGIASEAVVLVARGIC
jgi:hypothetical protein